METKRSLLSSRQVLPALLITVGIFSMELFNPQFANGTVSSPAFQNPLKDTAKKVAHVHPRKKAARYRGEDSPDNSYQSKKLEELSAQVEKQSEALNQYYNSDAFKATEREMELKGKQMQEFYDRPELKKMQDQLTKTGEEFSKNWGENDKQKLLSEQMGEAGKKMGVYFNSKKFKQLNASLKKKYGIPENQNFNDDRDENYKKYQAELDSKLPAEIKHQTEQLKQMGSEMQARYDSPEFKAQSKKLKDLGDSLQTAYNNPSAKQMQRDMDALSKQITAYQDNPKLKRQHELLDQAVKRLNDYIKSPEYKSYLRQMKKYSYNYKFNDDAEQPEKPDQPEKPEQPENKN